MLNKEATRFLNRKAVKQILANKVLSADNISRLNRFFTKFRCKEVEFMHATISKFVLYDLNNYEGRMRRLKGIPGTTMYTQLLRYGKKQFSDIVAGQSIRKTSHFANTMCHWKNQGFTDDKSSKMVSQVQKSRSLRSPSSQKGATEFSARCVGYWIKKGLSEKDAKLEVSKFQHRKYTAERNERWQKTLKNKSATEIAEMNAKKGHSVDSYVLRGMDYDTALRASNDYYAKRNNYSKSSQAFFSRLESELASCSVYYKTKNYEKQINGRCVDFYDSATKTVVEYYGDFWHRNPDNYSATFIAYNKQSSTIWKEDELRITKIKESADVRKVIIVWESAVAKNPQQVIDHILMEIKHGS